jgi:adenylate cyclase
MGEDKLEMPPPEPRPATALGQPSGPAIAGPAPDAASPPPAHTGHTGHSGHLQHPEFPLRLAFIDKLKKRNVGRVAVLYIITAYLVLEVFELFFHLLEMPAWAGRTMVLLAVLGFPAALVFAWIYEITPEGIRLSEEVDPMRSIATQTGRRLDRVIISVLAIALSYFVADKFWLSKRVATGVTAASASTAAASLAPLGAAVVSDRSVAVLPFVDMSEKHDQEYFADGLTEELIDVLTRSSDLKVPARTSSFFFKGKQVTISTIAIQLGVRHVLEGSVRKSGNTLRITAQLIQAESGYHLWSNTYDRKVTDVFKIQDEIAAAISTALNATLRTGAKEAGNGTSNIEAYDLLMQARALMSNFSTANANVATGLLDRALQLDPRFGRALALRSRFTCGGAWNLDPGAQREAGLARCRAEALRAVSLDPTQSDSYVALGLSYTGMSTDMDAQAMAEYQSALTLNPRNADAYFGLSQTAKFWLQPDRAYRLAVKAYELDPLNQQVLYSYATANANVEQYHEAERAWRRLLELGWESPGTRWRLAALLAAEGKTGEAHQEFELAGVRALGEPYRQWVQALLGPALDQRAAADAALASLERGDFKDISRVDIADIYAFRGDATRAFEWLNRQADVDTLRLDMDLWEDFFVAKYRNDPRYQALRQRLRLPDTPVTDVVAPASGPAR